MSGAASDEQTPNSSQAQMNLINVSLGNSYLCLSINCEAISFFVVAYVV